MVDLIAVQNQPRFPLDKCSIVPDFLFIKITQLFFQRIVFQSADIAVFSLLRTFSQSVIAIFQNLLIPVFRFVFIIAVFINKRIQLFYFLNNFFFRQRNTLFQLVAPCLLLWYIYRRIWMIYAKAFLFYRLLCLVCKYFFQQHLFLIGRLFDSLCK